MIALALLAASAIADAKGHLSPAAFEFVKPGVTRAQVDERLGTPFVSSIGVVAKGEIDLFVDELPPPPKPGARRRETEPIHYYEFRTEKFPLEFARIVFRGDTVWYAQLPPKATERTRQAILERYGAAFKESVIERNQGNIARKYSVHRLPAKGLAFVEHGGKITHRVVFPAEKPR